MNQKTPIFKEVAGQLTAQIRRRELTPGAVLPSENELCRQFSISRFSVRKALDILETDGLIFRQAGVGSFVSDTSTGGKPLRVLNIGVTAAESGNPYATAIYEGARRACAAEDARLILTSTDDFIAREGNDFDGFILLNMGEGRSVWKKLDAISAAGTPVVFLNRFTDLANIAYFSVDYELESRRALEFLFQIGRTRTGLISCSSASSYADETRSRGYAVACREAGKEELHCRLPRLDISAVSHVEEFLRKFSPDALFLTVGDFLDYVLLGCHNCGREIGRDLTVLCFDKVATANPESSGVMHIDMPLAEMAAEAVQYIGGMARGRDPIPVPRRLVSSKLIFNTNII